MTVGTWTSTLLSASIEGGLLLLAVWAMTRLWPHMPASARCGLWWVGSLRMLYGLLPLPPLPMKLAADWLPSPLPLPAPVLEWGQAVAGAVTAPRTASATAPPEWSTGEWMTSGLAIVWAAGLVIGAVLMARRIVQVRRTWHEAVRFDDPRVLRWQGDWALALGRARVPEVRVSPDTHIPVTIGCRRPGLLLPVDARSLSDDALRMVFAHELSHVRRHDPLLAWVPAAARLVFWFHPVVRLAAREYLAAREQICDADALRATGVAPRDYGSMLVAFGVGHTSDLPGAAPCGSPGARDLKRRLDMLSRSSVAPPIHRVGAAAVVTVVVALGFAPVRLVVAHEGHDLVDKSAKGEKHGRSPVAYLIKTRGVKGTRGAVDMIDMKAARRLDRDGESAVYFRLGDEMWISHDEGLIAEVRKALEPEDDFDARQSVVEGRRDALEAERAKLEIQREEIEERKGVLEAMNAELDRKLEKLMEQKQPTRAVSLKLEDVASQLETLWRAQEKLSRANDMLSERMKALYADDKAAHANLNALHEKVLEQVAEIARRAIEDGRAEVMTP